MAYMIPHDIQEFTTEGEGKFYRFLSAVAKPDYRYVVWYLPNIKGREPDFLLYSDQLGLVIFEVKDWALEQIRSANPVQFELQEGSDLSPKKNPLAQAREYFIMVVERIKEDGHLLSKDPTHYGNPRIPINYGVVFPNILRNEYLSTRFREVIDGNKIFFADDIQSQSHLASDSSGERFSHTLQTMFPPQFPFSVTPKEFSYLRNILFPEVRIELPERKLPGYMEQSTRLRLLDHNQEAIARKYDSGQRILVGPSGSGKTIILVHKAALLKLYNPAIKTILFLCYNITLVNYVRRLLGDKKVPLGKNGVEVYHFFELCSAILGEEIKYEGQDRAYYETVVGLTAEKIKESDLRYDAILVDEGQDFSDDMYRVVTSLLNPTTNSLTIAVDDNQNIYNYPQSWKALGVQAKGRVHKISSVYRNTNEIATFAAKFLSRAIPLKDSSGGQQPLFEDYFDYHGPAPKLKLCKDFDDLLYYVAEQAKNCHEQDGCPYSEIAVVYPTRLLGGEKQVPFPRLVEKALSSRGIMSNWASEDYRSKKSYDITTDSVTISTIHSMKGLDYACVFLVGLDFLEPKEFLTMGQIRNLAYVGLTRARYHLFVPYLSKTPLIIDLLSSL